MKNHVTALVEAVRLARLELACYRDPCCGASADRTVIRLSEVLDAKTVTDAMASLTADAEGPSIVPEEGENLAVPYPWRVRHH